MDFYDLLFDNFETNLLVFSRVIGIFAFNPILSRRNVPTMVRVICCLLIAMIVIMVKQPEPVDTGEVVGVYLMMILREGFIGVVLGFVTDMFFYSVQMGGEVMDMQAGLGMAKVFDPGTNMQMSIMGSFVSFMMYLYFFVTNAHMTYIELFVRSFDIIPLGTGGFNSDLGIILVEYFSVVLTLVMKIAMPIVVSQMILQFCVGVLMKSVPQIQIMVVNIQLKVGFGFLILFLVAVPLSNFIDTYMDTWIETLEGVLPLIPAQ
ncbi:MAG: flagellar biosynthetic protein FliR [Oscillospiraceae bacterium]|nr:flagellar biosynthetic protein FliR [Oscillospiraceae bacterium]